MHVSRCHRSQDTEGKGKAMQDNAMQDKAVAGEESEPTQSSARHRCHEMTFTSADRADVLSSVPEGFLSHHGTWPNGCSDDHNSGTGRAVFGIVPDFGNQKPVWRLPCQPRRGPS